MLVGWGPIKGGNPVEIAVAVEWADLKELIMELFEQEQMLLFFKLIFVGLAIEGEIIEHAATKLLLLVIFKEEEPIWMDEILELEGIRQALVEMEVLLPPWFGQAVAEEIEVLNGATFDKDVTDVEIILLVKADELGLLGMTEAESEELAIELLEIVVGVAVSLEVLLDSEAFETAEVAMLDVLEVLIINKLKLEVEVVAIELDEGVIDSTELLIVLKELDVILELMEAELVNANVLLEEVAAFDSETELKLEITEEGLMEAELVDTNVLLEEVAAFDETIEAEAELKLELTEEGLIEAELNTAEILELIDDWLVDR